MKHLLGNQETKEIDFLGGKLVMRQMSVSDVKNLQEKLDKKTEKGKESSLDDVDTLFEILKVGVEGVADLTKEEFETFPMKALGDLVSEVMIYSGMKAEEVGND